MLNVHVGKQQAGELYRSDLNASQFMYQYELNCKESQAVSLTMPIIRDVYQSAFTLHPIFDMNLPEGDLAFRLNRAFSKTVPNFDDLSLLEIVGYSQIGRLSFTSPNRNESPIEAQSVRDLILYDGAEGLFDSLFEKYATYSGVSGAQPKVMVRDQTSTAEPLSRISHRGATHIVKAWNAHEFPQLAANEYFCMRAALHSGLPVANFELSTNGVFFITERFDIEEDDYLGFEDFCVLNGYSSREKYQGSYEGIAKRIREYVSPECIPAALTQFFKTLALSCAVRNGDAHLKNFAVLYKDTSSQVSLAPTYDIVTTTVYVAQDTMALTLGGSKRWPKAKALLSFAQQQCGLSLQQAKTALEEVRFGLAQSSDELALYIEEHPAFREFGSKLKGEWVKGVAHSLSLNAAD